MREPGSRYASPIKPTDMEVNILLIEDDPSLGYLISEYLKMKGFEVDWEKDGKAGLLAAGKKVYDLCILDVRDTLRVSCLRH